MVVDERNINFQIVSAWVHRYIACSTVTINPRLASGILLGKSSTMVWLPSTIEKLLVLLSYVHHMNGTVPFVDQLPCAGV